ncbi:MAG: DNA recombination protein RmuC [Bacteroidota bacterium]|jgi:DNA recombination protein RmuC|nr:DNA recombination protein RmuC [Sphingobacteriales bacterium]
MMELIYLFVGIIIGFALAWLMKKSAHVPVSGEDAVQLRNDILQASNEASAWKSRFEQLTLAYEQAKAEVTAARLEIIRLNNELTAALSNGTNLEKKLAEQKQELEKMGERFKTDFENLANKILDEKSLKFTEQNRNNLDEILKPFNEKIKDFEKKVGEAYDKEMRDKISLREEVKKLYELNAKISEEANNLTKALKGDTKRQGNWGELILEKVLERSGLVKDREYRTQVVTKNIDGETIKPDVVVFLPDEKHLVIDSKVSLTAYEQMASTDDSDMREKLLKDHVNSVRNHVKLLSDKNYYTSSAFSTPDFVLLFLPMESAFSAAIQHDQDLFNYAWERRTVIVSPTTLLATLKTVASLWKIESQNRYAVEIAGQAGALYDKFEGFVKDLLEIGKKMDDSKRSYEEAMKKISTGTGNLIKRVENLKTLGAKATKSLPQTLLDRANEE